MDKETIEKFDLRQFVKSWLLPLAAEIAILLVIFNFVINITYVPTGSMIPTISEHSVLISLREYNTDELQRGEIYSFHSDELGKTLIKRLIGLPGETVRIEGNGNIYINDVRLTRVIHLLETSEMPVTQICLECGFNNIGNFQRLFRRKTGTTLLQYRKHFLSKKSK